jgi:23S rRNA (cytidine1920-2'-O)/16S rRNA (cytidine1409-2'-O)-methyltransferase
VSSGEEAASPIATIAAVAESCPFVSRGGLKLDHALATFQFDVIRMTCADLGCSTGGFTDCLLQRGAAKVFAVDTGYGVLDWKLRNDPRVVVLERTNALHVALPERVDLVVIDAAWTRQKHILPAAAKLLRAGGSMISLVKPHYEASAKILRKGILPDEHLVGVLDNLRREIESTFDIVIETHSPIKGAKGNTELLWLVRPRAQWATASQATRLNV